MSKAFDNFHLLSTTQRRFILNDDELIKDLVHTNLSDKRFKHTLGVAELAQELAIAHHVDVRKAYLAAMFHDVTKEFDSDFHDGYLHYYDPEKLSMPDPVKHSYSAVYYIREKLNFHDKDVLNAMYHHTICNSASALARILFIADKREPGRKIDDQIVEVAFSDLKKAYLLLQEDVKEYLKNKGEPYVGSAGRS